MTARKKARKCEGIKDGERIYHQAGVCSCKTDNDRLADWLAGGHAGSSSGTYSDPDYSMIRSHPH